MQSAPTPEAFFDMALRAAVDSRSNIYIAAIFPLSWLQQLGEKAWEIVDPELFIRAEPGFQIKEVLELGCASSPFGIFDAHVYFASLRKMKNSKVRAMVASTLIFYGMHQTGDHDLANRWRQTIFSSVRNSKFGLGIPHN